MADEELAPTGELEPETAPVVEEAPEIETPEDPANPVEALASELGWAPKDQFRGNPDDWKPADEFIRAGRDIQRSLSRDIKELKGNVSRIVSASTATLEQEIERQRAELDGRLERAVEEGDYKAAKHVTNQLRELDSKAPINDVPPTPEGQDFASRHSSWYGKDPEATAYAQTRAGHYGSMNLSPARALAAVEKDMKELFPEHFPAPSKAPPSVARPASRTASTSGRAKGFHDMPADAQAVARDMVDRGVIPSTDVYVANWNKQQERKVG